MSGTDIAMAAVVLGIAGSTVRSVAAMYVRRMERKDAVKMGLPVNLDSRLSRIEQAVDSIAVEVERVSEAQRFTSRLLSESARAEPGARPASSAPK